MLVSIHQTLDRERFDPAVVSLFGPNPLAADLQGHGIPVTCYDLSGPEELPKAVRLLRGTVKSFRPHLIHTHLFAANVAGRLAALGNARVVTTLHNPDYGRDAGKGWRFFARSFSDRLSGQLFPSRLLAVSEHVRDDFRLNMGFQGIDIFPNATEVRGTQVRAAGMDREGLRRELGWDPDWFVILHVGRLHRQKGQDVLVAAFAKVLGRIPTAKLVLAGDGPARPGIEAQVRAAGLSADVTLLGTVADVLPLLVAADVFAFPSRFEAFGIALLEAMAVGLPSVVSRIPGLTEVVDTTTSITVPPDDPVGLATAIERLHGDEDLRQRLGEGGRARASSFDLAPAVRRLEAIYLDEVRRGGGLGAGIPDA